MSGPGTKTWLYLYENRSRRQIYIGIGNSMTRAYEPHTVASEELRDQPATAILQTVTAFPSREAARLAEAVAIHVAALAGLEVISDHEDIEQLITEAHHPTNIVGVRSTRYLVPAVLSIQGTMHYSDLTRTALVALNLDQVDDLPTLNPGRSVATFAGRAVQTWPLQRATLGTLRPTRLLAILKGSHTIIGDWDLDPDTPLTQDSFVLADPEADNPRGIKGQWLDLDEARLSDLVTWSQDLREFTRR